MRWLEGRVKTAALVGMISWMGCVLAREDFSQSASTTLTGAGTADVPLENEDLSFGDFEAFAFDYQEESDVELKQGDIKRLIITAFDLEVGAGVAEDVDLSFFDSVDIYFESDSIERTLIATQNVFPEGEAFVAFDLPEADLALASTDEMISITTEVSGVAPVDDVPIEANVTFEIGVGLIGACRVIELARDLSN